MIKVCTYARNECWGWTYTCAIQLNASPIRLLSPDRRGLKGVWRDLKQLREGACLSAVEGVVFPCGVFGERPMIFVCLARLYLPLVIQLIRHVLWRKKPHKKPQGIKQVQGQNMNFRLLYVNNWNLWLWCWSSSLAVFTRRLVWYWSGTCPTHQVLGVSYHSQSPYSPGAWCKLSESLLTRCLV